VRWEFDEVFLIKLSGIVVHNEAAIDFEEPDKDERSDCEASENVQGLLTLHPSIQSGAFGSGLGDLVRRCAYALVQHGPSVAVKHRVERECAGEDAESQMRDEHREVDGYEGGASAARADETYYGEDTEERVDGGLDIKRNFIRVRN